MTFLIIPDVINFILLCYVFVILWRKRNQYHSLLPFSFAVALFSIGRIIDVIMEISISHSSPTFGWKREMFELILTNLGNTSDTIGILCLIFGFLKTIEYQKQEQKRIKELETLLPPCAWCKKYRTDDGEWKPIEQYLYESGASMTHGICPDCAAKMEKGILVKQER